jgi:hypothetical protein
MVQEYIEIRGARENNLKDVSLRLPKRNITIFTGVSGSGKSSMVFDTIANEAQRLLFENFSLFIRNFLPRYPKPDADAIENLSMAVIVDQKRLGADRNRPWEQPPTSRPCCACSFRGSESRMWVLPTPFPSTIPRACVWSVMGLAARSELTPRR